MIPVVVSMGDYAASGGYFIALSGDYVIAEPLSITGSIGVLGGKMVLSELWKKLDVNWGEVKFGRNAGILSVNHPFSPEEKRVFNRSLDNIYKDFTEKRRLFAALTPTKWSGLPADASGWAKTRCVTVWLTRSAALTKPWQKPKNWAV